MLTVHALLVDAPSLDERVSEDPDDEMFLAAALAANARLIVSGDKHLLRVSGRRSPCWRPSPVRPPTQDRDRGGDAYAQGEHGEEDYGQRLSDGGLACQACFQKALRVRLTHLSVARRHVIQLTCCHPRFELSDQFI